MARSQNSFIKRKKAEQKKKKKQEKMEKRMDKKNQEASGSLEDMIAYVDEEGNISSEPAENDTSESNYQNKNNNQDEKRNS